MRSASKLHYVAFFLLISFARVAAIELVGCYSKVDDSDSQGTDQYQTSSLCAGHCPNSPYVALKNGNECYCLSKKPSGSGDSSSCNTGCFGFGSQMCGGDDAFSVYTGNGSESDDDSLLSSAPELTSAEPLSTSSSETSTTSSKPTTTRSTSKTAQQVTSTRSQDGSVVVKTVTALASQTSSSKTSETALPLQTSKSDSKENKSGGTKVGPIVGGVVGGVAALVIIALVAVFFIRKRKNDEEYDEEEFYDKPEMARGGTNKLKRGKTSSPLDRPMSNPFTDPSDAMVAAGGRKDGLVDPRLNPVMMGRRRLSEGSLADETDYSRKILQVANPDN